MPSRAAPPFASVRDFDASSTYSACVALLFMGCCIVLVDCGAVTLLFIGWLIVVLWCCGAVVLWLFAVFARSPGRFFVSLAPTSGLRNFNNYSQAAYSDGTPSPIMPLVVGTWGNWPAPSIVRLQIYDYSVTVGVGVGDVISVEFDQVQPGVPPPHLSSLPGCYEIFLARVLRHLVIFLLSHPLPPQTCMFPSDSPLAGHKWGSNVNRHDKARPR